MSIKCAEIFFSNSGNFTFTCTLCQENFFKAIVLAEHMIDNHFFSIYPDALKSPFLIEDKELVSIRDLFASKKDICLEESSSDLAKDVLQSIEIEFEKLHSINDNSESNNATTQNAAHIIENEILPDEKTIADDKIPNILIANTEMHKTLPPVSNKMTTVINKIKSKMAAAQKSNLIRKNNIQSSIYWKCHICNKVIRKASRCRHMDMHQYKKYKYICKFCDEFFYSNSKLQQHIRVHTGGPERPYECSQCNNKYKIVSHLKEHIKRAHLKLRNYKCNFCEKAFFSNDEAKRHEISWHSQPKPNICEICGLGFTTTQQFRNHKRRHAEPTFQCNKCDKKFHIKRSLKIHEICHNEYKPYQCKICLTRFPRHKSYTRHMVLHSGIKDYICKICGKAFAQASGIGCHMKSHGIKYNACNVIRKSKTVNEMDNDLE